MNTQDANTILAVLAGYWPSPPIYDEEAVAWVEVLTDPKTEVSMFEARAWISRQYGDDHRPRPARLAEWVKSERRASANRYRELEPPPLPPEVVAEKVQGLRDLVTGRGGKR